MKTKIGAYRLPLLLLLVSLISIIGISSNQALAKQADSKEICLECISVGQCLECHDEIDSGTFASSAHGSNACTSCHRDIWDLDKHADCEVPMQPVKCGFCHKKEARQFAQSVHADNDVACTDCHANIHELVSSDEFCEESCEESCEDSSEDS